MPLVTTIASSRSPTTPVGPQSFPCFDPDEFTPYLNIAYDWTPDVMTYVTYSDRGRQWYVKLMARY